MIYIEEKEFERQIELLSYLANSSNFNVCAWLYPESTVSELAGFEITDNKEMLTPVTTYEGGFLPKRTKLIPAIGNILPMFNSSKDELKANCDSLALYKDNEPSWYAATIGHEGMCLVQDDTLLEKLVSAGFNATSEAPSWW